MFLQILISSLSSLSQLLIFGVIFQDIILNPYDEYESYFDKRVFFSRVVLINFDDVVYHQPDLVCRQLRIENLKKLPPMISLKISLPRGSTERMK